MTVEEFVETANSKESTPPHGVSEHLQALWWAKAGDWHKAHEISQAIPDREGSWIHAYLHRVEGDAGNAAYWYSRAEREMPSVDTDQEWEDITREIMAEEQR